MFVAEIQSTVTPEWRRFEGRLARRESKNEANCSSCAAQYESENANNTISAYISLSCFFRWRVASSPVGREKPGKETTPSLDSRSLFSSFNSFLKIILK